LGKCVTSSIRLVALSDNNERTVDACARAAGAGAFASGARNRGTVPRFGRAARSTAIVPLAPIVIALSLALCACSSAGSEAPDNLAALDDIREHHTHQQVTVEGTVAQVLPTQTTADGRHERFMLDVHTGSGDEQLILVAHNIEIAPQVPLQAGDDVIVHGDLELDRTGPVIHWTHHDPSGRHPAGFIKVHGQTYE
jgi:hypothetical protein